MRYLLSLFLFSLTLSSFAQTADDELAAQYFANEEYDKAEILYKKLHKKDPESVYIYQNYLECLLKLDMVADAEKMVAKQTKKFPDRPIYGVDLGYVYGLQGNDKEKDKLYNDLINETVERIKSSISVPTSSAELLASAFLNRSEYEFAKTTLLKTRKVVGIPTAFAQNLIDLYKITKEHEALIDECLTVLQYNAQELPATKANLIYLVDTDTKIDYLQERATVFLQKYPENTVFDELLLWVFIQQKKFNSALRQANAMDKRNQTEGKNLMDLARICLSNKDFSLATKCYESVVAFGEDGYFFVNAKMGALETSYLMVVVNGNYTDEDVNKLIGSYNEMIQVFGRNTQTARSIKQLSDIYIFYKHDLIAGTKLLKELVEMPRLASKERGEYKLALGDAMVMQNLVWDAALYYGQVDKAFKEDALGQEAKFRNARLSYFQGDFDWSINQLDVLKTATSQLIANNALELSLLIKDNTGLDSSTDAMKEFANAQLLLFQNKLDESLEVLNLIPFKYPKHALEDEIYYNKAKIFEKKREYAKAEEYYQNVIKYFADDILADNAIFSLAELYQFKLNEPQKALDMYEKIIFDYNASLFVVEARKRYKVLKPISSENP